jgi:hypothetical protein
LNGSSATVKSTLHNKRVDPKEYGPTGQELPAIYTNGPWWQLVTYNGTKPFTNDALNYYPTIWPPRVFTPTEHWAALVDKHGFGLGVIHTNVTTFLSGFSGPVGSGGPTDNPTGYMAPTASLQLPTEGDYSFEVTLVLGDAQAIRAVAADKRPAV